MKLEDSPSRPVTDTDGERAMCNAMETTFPGGGRLSCTQHLQGDQDYLKDKVGVRDTDRCAIIRDFLGKDGIVELDDALLFHSSLQTVLDIIETMAPAFSKYFKDTIVPLLEKNLTVSQK